MARSPRPTPDPEPSVVDSGEWLATPEEAAEALQGQDIEVSSSFDTTDLRNVKTFDEAFALARAVHGDIETASESMGDGFAKLTNKDVLIGRPILVLEWKFIPGDYGDLYTFMRVIAASPAGPTAPVEKYLVVDGGTGICADLQKYTHETGRTGALFVKMGFRKSEYDTDENGKPTKVAEEAMGRGVTYYLDTSA